MTYHIDSFQLLGVDISYFDLFVLYSVPFVLAIREPVFVVVLCFMTTITDPCAIQFFPILEPFCPPFV